jgi:hypothetical protein
MTRLDPALERGTRPIRDAAGAGAEESGISSPAEVGALSPEMGGGAAAEAAAGETLKAFSPSNPLCAEKKKVKNELENARDRSRNVSRVLRGLGLEV